MSASSMFMWKVSPTTNTAALSQTLEEERLVFVARATGRDARKIPRASPDRHDDDSGAELAGEIEQRGDVGTRGGDLLGIRIDQPAAVAARDRRDWDLLADRHARLTERRTLRELERVEAKAACRLVLLLERRPGHEPLLNAHARHDGARAIVVFISATST